MLKSSVEWQEVFRSTVTSRDDFKDARGEENLSCHLFQKIFWVEAFFEMFSLSKQMNNDEHCIFTNKLDLIFYSS